MVGGTSDEGRPASRDYPSDAKSPFALQDRVFRCEPTCGGKSTCEGGRLHAYVLKTLPILVPWLSLQTSVTSAPRILASSSHASGHLVSSRRPAPSVTFIHEASSGSTIPEPISSEVFSKDSDLLSSPDREQPSPDKGSSASSVKKDSSKGQRGFIYFGDLNIYGYRFAISRREAVATRYPENVSAWGREGSREQHQGEGEHYVSGGDRLELTERGRSCLK
jgi:hypothetical protein